MPKNTQNKTKIEPQGDASAEYDDDAPIIMPFLARTVRWWWQHRRRTVPATVVAVVIIVLLVPVSRYKVLSTVIKRDVTVLVRDSKTGIPISHATVGLGGHEAQTDANGRAILRSIPVGYSGMHISKPYHSQKTVPIAIGLRTPAVAHDISLESPNGLIPVQLVNDITGKPVPGVTLSLRSSTALTNERGETAIALPDDIDSLRASVSGDGYKTTSVLLRRSQQVVKDNTFRIPPAGNVYFISKTGQDYSLMRTDLDGENHTAVKTFGKNLPQTVLIAKDWSRCAYVANRALEILDTASGTTDIITEDAKNVQLIAWVDDGLMYRRGEDYFRFANGQSQPVDSQNISFDTPQGYLPSPGGLNSFWRDKRGLLVGDQQGENSYYISKRKDQPYGWFSDLYVLTKQDAALFIMPSNGVGALGKRVKLADGLPSQTVLHYGLLAAQE